MYHAKAPTLESSLPAPFVFPFKTQVHVYPDAIGFTKENGWAYTIIRDIQTSDKNEYTYQSPTVYTENGKLCIESTEDRTINIYTINGLKYTRDLKEGINKLELPKGIYIIEGRKVVL